MPTAAQHQDTPSHRTYPVCRSLALQQGPTGCPARPCPRSARPQRPQRAQWPAPWRPPHCTTPAACLVWWSEAQWAGHPVFRLNAVARNASPAWPAGWTHAGDASTRSALHTGAATRALGRGAFSNCHPKRPSHHRRLGAERTCCRGWPAAPWASVLAQPIVKPAQSALGAGTCPGAPGRGSGPSGQRTSPRLRGWLRDCPHSPAPTAAQAGCRGACATCMQRHSRRGCRQERGCERSLGAWQGGSRLWLARERMSRQQASLKEPAVRGGGCGEASHRGHQALGAQACHAVPQLREGRVLAVGHAIHLHAQVLVSMLCAAGPPRGAECCCCARCTCRWRCHQ